MDAYKLSNIIKRHMVQDKRNRYRNMSKKNFSFTYIKDLCEKYYVSEWTEHEHCCRGEDTCCWIEVHSSWMRHAKNYTDASYNKKVYYCIKSFVNEVLPKNKIGKRNMFIAEDDKYVIVCLPLRDVSKSDHWLVFDKRHPIS